MSKYTKLLSNTAILGAGTFISKVLVFLLMPFYTALLSTEQFGTADILTQTANLLIPLAALGIADGLFRFAIDTKGESRKEVFTNALTVVVIGIFPLAAVIQLLRIVDIYDGYIWLILFYICAANLHLVCANYLRACDKTKAFAVQGIANTVLTILLPVKCLRALMVASIPLMKIWSIKSVSSLKLQKNSLSSIMIKSVKLIQDEFLQTSSSIL